MFEYTISEISQEELDAEVRVRTEFQNLTNNQAYEHVLRYRVMTLKRGVTLLQSVSDIFGTDSRKILEILESQFMDENTRLKFFRDVLKPDDKIFDFRRLDFAIKELKAAAVTPVAIGEKSYGLTRCIRGEENVWRI
ncbi:1480_t:CDS:2, partial [Gigaspora rosea]